MGLLLYFVLVFLLSNQSIQMGFFFLLKRVAQLQLTFSPTEGEASTLSSPTTWTTYVHHTVISRSVWSSRVQGAAGTQWPWSRLWQVSTSCSITSVHVSKYRVYFLLRFSWSWHTVCEQMWVLRKPLHSGTGWHSIKLPCPNRKCPLTLPLWVGF